MLGKVFVILSFAVSGMGEVKGSPAQSTVEVLLGDYLQMKDALVADNTWGAALAASRLKLNIIRFIQTGSPSGPGSKANPFTEALSPLDQISGTGNIDLQRRYFAEVSGLARQVLADAGLLPVRVFVQHCPMVFQNRGAYWLSTQESVQNPYFGAKMLHCGKVTGIFDGLTVAPAIDPELLSGKLESKHVHGCHGPGQ